MSCSLVLLVKKLGQDCPKVRGNPGLDYNPCVRFVCRNAIEPGQALNELPHPQVVLA